MISEWVSTIKFPECENIVKYGKVSGAVLMQNLNFDYLSDTLGITGETEAFKFITEVKKVEHSEILGV